jgi:thymidylate kinase
MRHRRISLVAFSGLDGCGKSTQIAALRARLERDGRTTAVVWTRGGYTPLFEGVKTLARRLAGGRLPPAGPSAERSDALARTWMRRLWLMCAIVDLAVVFGVKVRLLRCCGRVVLCDRYLHDSLIDFRLMFGADAFEDRWLWRLMANVVPAPDVAFLLLLPAADSVQRSERKGDPFCDPTREILARRVADYGILAAGGACRVLDATRAEEDLAREIAATVESPTSAYEHQPAA